jgi:hypothetical protein
MAGYCGFQFRRKWIAAALGVGLAGAMHAPAFASVYCPDRPGLDTPPCVIDRGYVSMAMSLGDWTRDSDAQSVTDTILLGDLALRLGIGQNTELRFAWTPYGQMHSRDRAGGTVASSSGAGDLTLAAKRNILHPGGEGLSIAVLPSVTLPVGGDAIGSPTWSAGLQLPMSLAAFRSVFLMLTPELDAAANGDGSGRHLDYGTAGGIGLSPLNGVNLALETSVMRDEEPSGPRTEALAGASLGVMLASGFQVDVGADFGLNRASPRHHFYAGLARRF